MVFDAPNPKKFPSIILSFQNYRPECIAMCSNFRILLKVCYLASVIAHYPSVMKILAQILAIMMANILQ